LVRIGNYFLKCWEQRLGSKLGRDSLISWILRLRSKTGLMKKIEKSLNYTLNLGENGHRLASIYLVGLKTKSKIDFIPTFKKTTI